MKWVYMGSAKKRKINLVPLVFLAVLVLGFVFFKLRSARQGEVLASDELARKGLAMSQTQYPQDRELLKVGWWAVWNWGCPVDDLTCVNMLYSVTDPLDSAKCQPYILFLNEPNNKEPYGSPTTPEDAARRLIELEAICPPPATQFVAGNVANPTVGTSARTWLEQFLGAYQTQAGKPFSQILGTHCYGYVDFYKDPKWCVNSLKEIRSLYSGGMWVTEFNTIEDNPNDTSFLETTIDYIAKNFDRFAIYTNRQDRSAGWAIEEQVELIDMNTGQLRPKGEMYASWPWPSPSLVPTPTPTPASEFSTFKSVAADDGFVLESGEKSSKGGAVNPTNAFLRVGDNNVNSQYRAVISFDTASLPDNAVLKRAVVKVKRMSGVGTNPFTTHGSLVADVVKGWFDGSSALESKDFQAKATTNKAGIFSVANGDGEWSTAELTSSGLGAINLTGKTQFRVRFTTDDNNDKGADYLNYASGDNADSSAGPVLKVEY